MLNKKLIFLVTCLIAATHTLPAFSDTLIVGNKREHTVSFINLDSGEEVVRRKTGKAPHEVAVSPDGKTAVVVSYRSALFKGHSLHVFDIPTGTRKKVIELGEYDAPHGLKWLGNTNNVVVTSEGSRHLMVVDIENASVVGAVKTQAEGSHMVALSPESKLAYVANMNSSSFSVISLEDLKLLRKVTAGDGTEAISVSPDGAEIWVGNNDSQSVMVFDSNTFELVSTLEMEGVPIRVELSPDGQYAAVSLADLDRVQIYQRATRELVETIDLAASGGKVPVTMLWSGDSEKLWVATTQAARVLEIQTGDWQVSRTLHAGKGSDGLGYSSLSTIKPETE